MMIGYSQGKLPKTDNRLENIQGKQTMKSILLSFTFIVYLFTMGSGASEPIILSRADYEDRVHAIWYGQIIGVMLTLPFEHKTATVESITGFPKAYSTAFVDDDWYYEMCTVRAFEKHGIGLSVQQLGEQWLENSCGSWGSSAMALANLKRGIAAPDCGHPRYNRRWWTIGPIFTADLFGALTPGMPNEAGRLARELCSINGYGEALDGGVLFSGAISLGFVERDVKSILRKSVTLVHPSSPYRQCVDAVIQMADSGKSFDAIVLAVEDKWRTEYPASNNAVSNGGITAACLWFGEGDFWKTVNLASGAADFSDTDNSAATAIAVLAAMNGMKILPADLVSQLHDRIVGGEMGGVKLTPPVDESIGKLAKRTAAIGEKIILAQGGKLLDEQITINIQVPMEQPAQRFLLNDLMQYWNSDWTLERAGLGGDGVGAMPGLRGMTYLDGETLVTYPRDEARGLLLRRRVKLSDKPLLKLRVGSEPKRFWELLVYVGNEPVFKRTISGSESVGKANEIKWETLEVDLAKFKDKEVVLRLYQRTLMPGEFKLPGNAHWQSIEID